MKLQVCIFVLGFLAFGLVANATPLDDTIEAFKAADEQTENAVTGILKTGIDEGRAAEALNAVRSWLSSNPTKSQALNFYAGRAMEYSGNWSDAVIVYSQLLKSQPLHEKLAGIVVPATYRLMINDMRDENTAYLFMREEGNRLRRYGRAAQFDYWFLREARKREDLAATAERLAAIFADPTANVSDYDAFVDALLDTLEEFKTQDKETVAAMNKLAAVSGRRQAEIKARWDWLREVVKLNAQVADLVQKGQEVPADIFAPAVRAANALVSVDPNLARLVVRDWADWTTRNDSYYNAFMNAQRDLKAEPILLALSRLPTEDAKALLGYVSLVAGRRGATRDVPLLDFLSDAQKQALARSRPELRDAINNPKLGSGGAKRPPVKKGAGPVTSESISAELLALPDTADATQVEAALRAVLVRVSQASELIPVIGVDKVANLPTLEGTTRKLALTLFNAFSPLGDYPTQQGYEQLGLTLVKDMQKSKRWAEIVPYASSLWRVARQPDNRREPRLAEALTRYSEAALDSGQPSVALSLAQVGMRSGVEGELHDRLNAVAKRAKAAMGMFAIKASEADPAYALHKGSAEYQLGNLKTAWELYLENDALLMPTGADTAGVKAIVRKLNVEYLLWLLKRNISEDRLQQAEVMVKELTLWSREDEALLSGLQQADLQIAYADLLFRKGHLPTARAWYRKVADAREYRGTEVGVRAGLGSVKVDRVSKNFEAALTELDRLARIDDPQALVMVHFARAQVLTDQENYKGALSEVDAVLLRDPNHEDAKILQGEIEIHMRRLVEATEIELGVTRENTVLVPGESLKVNLVDPMLNVSGVGADIEIEVWAKSGDRERVMLHPLGDDQTKYRADVPTALGPPVPGDKTLQVLGKDEVRYGYSQRFRAKMKDLPPDPDTVITIAADAQLAFASGAFPPRKGERKLSINELGLSSAQAKLGLRRVRPGNPVYLRVIDPDRSATAGIDTLPVSLETSSGDSIRRLLLKETGPYTGEFEAVIPTAGAQATAMASESAPGRDPNMSISAKDYPGWLGQAGDLAAVRTFTVDLNDNVALGKMMFAWSAADKKMTHLILETSLNGREWVRRGSYPKEAAPWDGQPHVEIVAVDFEPSRGGVVPSEWRKQMELGRLGLVNHAASEAPLSGIGKVLHSHRWSGRRPDLLMLYRALFYQRERTERTFQITGLPKGGTTLLIDGRPGEANESTLVRRELAPGLHSVEIWCYASHSDFSSAMPVLLCDVPDEDDLQPCPDSMFDSTAFPEDQLAAVLDQGTRLTYGDGGLEIAFDDRAEARLIRMNIYRFEGTAPGLGKVTLTGRDGKAYLPVKYDFMALNDNDQLEVLPGDTITARYDDPVPATPGRNLHAGQLEVAYNTAAVSASFLNYKTTDEGRTLTLEPIRRFHFKDAVAFVIEDIDMDTSPERDIVDFVGVSSGGGQVKLKAVEDAPHSGRFVGRIFPVAGEPQRDSEIEVPEGGTLMLVYRDMENLDPGIPADRRVVIEHAMYRTPEIGVYTARSELLPPDENGLSQRSLAYDYVDESQLETAELNAVIGSAVRFDVVVPHLALSESSRITAYVQTEAGRQLARKSGKDPAAPYDITVPGTKKLTGILDAVNGFTPEGYVLSRSIGPKQSGSTLDAGRFIFSFSLVLGDCPTRSLATQDVEERGVAETQRGLPVYQGDVVHIGYAWKDEAGKVQWKTASVRVGSHAFMDVMDARYTEKLERVFVGERIFVRVRAPGLDRGAEHDWASVTLRASSGAEAAFRLRETAPHSGLFKGSFVVNYAPETLPTELPAVELNGFPVRYGDEVTVTYPSKGGDPDQVGRVAINMGADGNVEPFSKRFTGDEMAVRTIFTLSECFFELAKHHRQLEQESLARREMAHAKKLLQESLATHRDDNLRAHAEYLLGNLAQEYAGLAKNDEAKLPMYKDALARFSQIPIDYPDSEFADKAQFKTALVYEKIGESEIAMDEYVKLAYKYPESEHIPEAMSRLAIHFQKIGQAFKDQADTLRDKTDVQSLGEILRLEKLATPEFIKAATIYGKLEERFPDHKLAGLAGLAAAQNYMRAHKYDTAIAGFTRVVENEDYDDMDIRAQALFWQGLCYERIAGLGKWDAPEQQSMAEQSYRRVTFDFPDSKWAKFARGRLATAQSSRK